MEMFSAPARLFGSPGDCRLLLGYFFPFLRAFLFRLLILRSVRRGFLQAFVVGNGN